MSKIFGDDDADVEIQINNGYAKNYDTWRKKEELNKLKTKYGDELEHQESSSSSEDDEQGIELTEEIEKQFFKTLSYLKNKDPRIYDQNINFFELANGKTERVPSKKKDKPVFISDYERELLLQKRGELDDNGDVGEAQIRSPTYTEEQNELRESFKKALSNVTDDVDEEWGGMLKLRQKTKEEQQQEEVEYKEWLAGQKEKIGDEDAIELQPLKDYWNDPKLDDGEKFLRDYVLKKKFLSKEDADYIPTYEEIVHDSDKDLSEDEDAIERQEEFEYKYNFRFEEPDQEFIKRYPRTVDHSLRKTDDKRKLKRAETKQRKQKEKEQKIQELNKMQELKRKEIEEKIEKLREITGNTEIDFQDDDLEGDFNPEAHDKRMQVLFNDTFYEGAEEDQKPQFPELDEYLEIENWERWKGADGELNIQEDNPRECVPHCEDEDFNMDCDYDPDSTTIIQKENGKGRKKRKRKSLFANAVNQQKPVFDPNEKSYEEYLDEYYKLDCEDFIGDIPCKFKYRKVTPNSFGLTTEEILLANDRELNKWCSLKKAVQYRPDHVEKYDQIAYEKKGKNLVLKQKILPSVFQNETVKSIDITQQGNNKNTEDGKNKNKRKRKITINDMSNESELTCKQMGSLLESFQKHKKSETNKHTSENKQTTKIKKNSKKAILANSSRKDHVCKVAVPNKKSKQTTRARAQDIGISEARLSAYGINPKKFKNKLKYGKL